MKCIPAILFALGYFPGVYALIHLLAMTDGGGGELNAAENSLIWALVFMPMAICGTIALCLMRSSVKTRMIAGMVSLAAVLLAMLILYHIVDAAEFAIFIAYALFAVGFTLMVVLSRKKR